ncbi:hypothetical protein TrST_g10894 [Triparma strigata]|uniref:peptidyl-tRNA hydrolase n=1 Tax=Triparma strigata TaxID=1606541 RepID=A0A9W6ZVP5_9STRA|nr:hypothetical protein TrST_g10894 [Triparma strigata]
MEMLKTTPTSYAFTLLFGLLLGSATTRYLTPPSSPSDSDSDSDYDSDSTPVPPSTDPKQWGIKNAPYKMVFAVNKSLKMGPGKIAAQCCHAAVGCYKRSMKSAPSAVRAWEITGCAKVCLKLPNETVEEEFTKIKRLCQERGVAYYLVEDAGRTQIAAGSRTVIGVGPAPVTVVDEITSHLKLM